jgi:hypothetical protein
MLILTFAACGDDEDRPGVIQPKGPEPTAISSGETIRHSVVSIDSRRAQYRFSKRICRDLGPARIAYENGEAGTVVEIAKRWAERTGNPAFRRENLDGCLDGFASRRAGRQ